MRGAVIPASHLAALDSTRGQVSVLSDRPRHQSRVHAPNHNGITCDLALLQNHADAMRTNSSKRAQLRHCHTTTKKCSKRQVRGNKVRTVKEGSCKPTVRCERSERQWLPFKGQPLAEMVEQERRRLSRSAEHPVTNCPVRRWGRALRAEAELRFPSAA